MPARYAASTNVPAEQTRSAIEKILTHHGAGAFAYATQLRRARIMFEMRDRRIMFEIALPDRTAREFTHTPTRGDRRSPTEASKAYDQAVRQRWRALYLVIRARLEALELGIETFEEAFLAHIMLPSGETVGQASLPAVADAYANPERPMPALLPGGDR